MSVTSYTQTKPAVPVPAVTPMSVPAKAVPSQTGVWVAVSAIAMSFAALTSALVVRQASGTDWQRFTIPRILYLDTLILIASSYTLELARKRIAGAVALRAGSQFSSGSEAAAILRSNGLYWLNITLALGLFFVAGQILAWRTLAAQGWFLATSPSSSFFYLLTAMHGLHVAGGILGLVYVGYRMRHNARNALTSLGTAAVYWHFVDLLWVYLLMVIAIRM